jgi:branched-chain amino acid transport system permease protein
MKFFLPRFLSIILGLGCLFLADRVVSGLSNDYVKLVIMLTGIFVTLAVSLNLINGITGQFSIGHAAFFQVGAYTGAVLANGIFKDLAATKPLLWLFCSAVFGALGAAIAGFVVGLPSLRLKGDYLAIVTLGFGEIISIIARNQKVLGEAYGLSTVKIQSFFMIALLAVITIAVCRNLLKTAHGLTFLAVREDEVASSSMGVNVTKVKVTAFVLGSAFAGAAGALLTHTKAFIGPADFTMDVSFIILTMVVLGGTGSITGSVFAAVIFYIIPEKMRDLPANIPLAYPVAALIAVFIAVAGMKKIQDEVHGNKWRSTLLNLTCVVVGVLLYFALSRTLHFVPFLKKEIIGSNLRMPVLAVTLVVLMLLRPQGIFGHYEFSLDMFKKLFVKSRSKMEVSH